ncbi:DUF3243 family protein [Sporosarcina sp. resist]|uniref:DUF3243 family protein n=1 Tax=Sporosarcina sp. resist TaxID=2762563 RepID=UPI00164D0909|nr:DUF3243 family protein [Sporosarcina sp. resist]QNK86269.1 DUF3243 family protein [Sporosarcina sp. resist]
MLIERVELGDNMGLSDEKGAKTTRLANGDPSNRELKMLTDLLESGSKDEQHMLAKALLEMLRKV